MAATAQSDLNEHILAFPYPVEVDLSYRMVHSVNGAESGLGRTVSISRSRVLFRPPAPLPQDQEIELDISWPARVHGQFILQVHVLGMTAGTENGCTAVRILHYVVRPRG
jgi:hypothetical protein